MRSSSPALLTRLLDGSRPRNGKFLLWASSARFAVSSLPRGGEGWEWVAGLSPLRRNGSKRAGIAGFQSAAILFVQNHTPFTSESDTPATRRSTLIASRCSRGRQRAAFLPCRNQVRAIFFGDHEKDTRTSCESHRRFRQWGPEPVGVGRIYLDSDRRSGIGKNPATLHRHPR